MFKQTVSPPPAYSPIPSADTGVHEGATTNALRAHQHPSYTYPAVSEDDFNYGVDVKSSNVSVRMDFVRKVYSILSAQLLLNAVVGGVMLYNETLQIWTQNNYWTLILSIVFSFISLGVTIWQRRSVPLNFWCLALFTLFESYTLGATVTFYDVQVVVQAVVITTGVFVGLTLFTLQTKYDFTGLTPWLVGSLWLLIITSLVSLFLPFNTVFDLVVAIISALVFMGFILVDTQNLFSLSPEEYILASITLYLDVINLFLSILRILQDLKDMSE